MQAAAGAPGASTFDTASLRHFRERQGQPDFNLGDVKTGWGASNSSLALTQTERIFRDFLALQALPKRRLTGPLQFVLRLLKDWQLEKRDIVALLGFGLEEAAHVNDVLDGLDRFRGRDVQDRIAHLFHIREALDCLFRNLDAENQWLREPHALLDEKSPLSLLLGGSMQDILLTRDYVDAAAGR